MAVDFRAVTDLRGLGLPARKGPGGYFAAKDKFEVAWGDILCTLLTPQGSRPGNRRFGSALYDLLFALGGPDQATLQYVVSQAVADHCPHLEVFQVVAAERASKGWEIGVLFGLRADRARTENRTILVPLHHVTEVA